MAEVAPSAPVTCTVRAVGSSSWPGGPDPGTVAADGGEVAFPVAAGLPVLHAMIRRALRVLPVGCRGGGCGVCRVRVVSGDYRTMRMSRRHVSEADEADRVALACRLLPSSDITVEWAPRLADPGSSPAPDTSDPKPVDQS